MMITPSVRYKSAKYSWVVPHFIQQRKRLLLLGILVALTVGLQLGNPLLLRAFLDAVTAQAEAQTYLFFAGLYIIAAFVLRGVRVGEEYIAGVTAWKATNALRNDLVRHCLSLDMSFHLAHTPGELIERIDGDVRELNNFFSRFVVILVTNALVVFGVIVILLGIDWRMGVLLGTYVCLYIAVIFWLNTKTVEHFVKSLEAEAALFGFLEARLSGTEDIRTSGATGYVLRGLTDLMRQRLSKQQHAEVVQGLISIVRLLITLVVVVTALIFSANLYQQGQITIGTAYIIYYYLYIIWDPLRDLVYQFSDFQKALAALRRISVLFTTESAITDGPGDALPEGALGVKFEDVSFGYNAQAQALQHISFHLEPGRKLGVLGETGSGKSTLARLLFRFYDPQQGQIRLNNTNIRDVTRQSLCARIGLVTQDVQLFYASLRDNVTFLDSTISDTAILDAFHTLGLSTWYAHLSDGLDTQLRHDSLSAGQAQLVALTRTFLKQPDLIILDEASSRLDPLTETLVQQALQKLFQGRTAIIIAHRLQTVNMVDDILVLAHGQISEYGTRETLAADRASRYAHLLDT